jgi:hypothetical protein
MVNTNIKNHLCRLTEENLLINCNNTLVGYTLAAKTHNFKST